MTPLSRQEIETTCVLYALGGDGCTAEELAARLGLGPSLSTVLVEVLESFIRDGWVLRLGDRFVVTRAGHEFVASKLATNCSP